MLEAFKFLSKDILIIDIEALPSTNFLVSGSKSTLLKILSRFLSLDSSIII